MWKQILMQQLKVKLEEQFKVKKCLRKQVWEQESGEIPKKTRVIKVWIFY